jgi:hypothetical protein
MALKGVNVRSPRFAFVRGMTFLSAVSPFPFSHSQDPKAVIEVRRPRADWRFPTCRSGSVRVVSFIALRGAGRASSLPDEIARQTVAKTDGVPLFVEELTQTLLE